MSFDRFRIVAGLELRTHLQRPLLWIMVLLAALATASLNVTAPIGAGDPAAGVRPFVNSQHAMAWLFAMSGFLVYSFFSAILAGTTVIRDDEHRVSELLHSTPLTPAEYVFGKLAGVAAAIGVALSLQVIFAMLFFELGPTGDALARGPFRLADYVLPALALAAPVSWVFAGLAFAVGERTRKPIAVFAVPITLFFAIFFFMSWTPAWLDPAADRLLMILDPSGLRWLLRVTFGVDRGVAFYNTTPVAFGATFLLNRLFVIGVTLLAVTAAVRHRRVAPSGGRSTKGPKRAPGASPEERSFAAAGVRNLGMTSSTPGFLASVIHVAGAEFRELRSQPGLYLFTPLIMMMVWEEVTSATDPFGAPAIRTAGTMAVETLGLVTFLVCLVLLFYTAESVYREKSTGLDAILFASPFRTGALLFAKGLANAAVVAVMLLAAAAVCLAVLLLQDQARVEIWPFVLVWGLVLPPTFLLWSAFVTAVLTVVRDRATTYAVGLGALLASAYHLGRESMSWVYNWSLLGALRWSDMGTFDLNGEALWLNRVTMIGLAIFLAAVAVRLFPRVERDAVARLQRLRPRNLFAGALRLAPFALLPLLCGGFLAHQVRAGFQGDTARQRAEDYRRRNFAAWADFEPARVTHVDLAVDLEPATRGLAVDGVYTVVNASGEPMRYLPFTVGQAFEDVAWKLDGSSVESDDRSGLHVLEPAAPLRPGERIRVGFAYRAAYPKGFTKNGGGVEQYVLPAGVSLHTLRNSFLPVPGFDAGIGEDCFEPAAVADDFWQEELDPAVGAPVPFTTRVRVTAPSPYTVNSVGVKTSQSTHDGRTTVVWESDFPVRAVNIVAGRWSVRREGATAVFHHPGHDHNAGEILDALIAARERYSEWFYPYPWQELRLNELPDLVANAQGFPSNVTVSESYGFLTASNVETKPAFLVTAHEAAHQWWGNLVAAADGPGTAHLVEGMAHYSALLLEASEHGLRGRIEMAVGMEESYGEQRRIDSEKPLIEMVDDTSPSEWTVVYEKGAWVQWMLHDHLGRDQTLAGLRAFIRHYVSNPDHPALQDLIEFLRPYAADPEAYQAFVDQWFFQVVLPELRIGEAAIAGSGSGWEVSATVENVGTGTVTVELAATRGERFPADAREPGPDYREGRTSVLLAPGHPRRVTWTVPFEPDRLVVDPDALVLQLNRKQASSDLLPRP